MTVVVNIHEAKTHLSRLLEQVAAGERVIISKAGAPIAELVPHRRQPVIIGGLQGKIRYSDADWDNADAEIAEMFYGSDASSSDSQVVLWLVDGNPRLGRRARDRIENADIVYVSAATIWELTIRKMLGKLDLPDAFDIALGEQGISYLPVTAEHAAAIGEFPELLRHDPFDRLLVAQASRERCDLVTADQVLLGTSYPFVVDATR